MTLKLLITHQHQAVVDETAVYARAIPAPREGWLRTMRKALGMSGAQLARRIGATRALISQTERNEVAGAASLRTLQQMAKAMGCKLVYAMVPAEGTTEDLIAARAKDKARALVQLAGGHMALEAQQLSPQQIEYEIERVQRQLISELPSDLWDDK